jgi:hypothetical protein
MPFGSKDLLTKAFPHAELAKLCLLRTCICRWPTRCFITCPKYFSCLRCSILITDIVGCQGGVSCGGGRSDCDPTHIDCFGSDSWVIQDLEDLVTIRAELNQTLQQLDAIEKEGLASGITTKEQADQVEQQLKGQLEHLRKVRQGLK